MENMIELRHVNKSFKDFQIKDLTLNVKKGFVTGFIGANGSGKSTTIKLMLNLLKPDSGDIKVFGMDYKAHEKEIKERIGFVFDDDVLYEDVTVNDLRRIIAPCYRQWDEKEFRYYTDLFAIPLQKKIKTFSKGMKMKVSLAIAFSHHAELLIFDEPTAGMDPIFRREFLDILHDFMLDENKTIFFSTHITSDLARIADYISFIHDGQLIFSKELHAVEEEYAIVRGPLDLLDVETEKYFVSVKRTGAGFEALTSNRQSIEKVFSDEALIEEATLEDVMYYVKRRASGVSLN